MHIIKLLLYNYRSQEQKVILYQVIIGRNNGIIILPIIRGKSLVYIVAAHLFLQHILILIILFWALLAEAYKRLIVNGILYYLFLRTEGSRNNIILTLIEIAKQEGFIDWLCCAYNKRKVSIVFFKKAYIYIKDWGWWLSMDFMGKVTKVTLQQIILIIILPEYI